MAIMVSHDCDIANDNLDVEPTVELVVGEVVKVANGNFTNAKSPRTLHLELNSGECGIYFEFEAKNKFTVNKEDLCKVLPSSEFQLSSNSKYILQDWLSMRYKRQSLPNNLDSRLKPLFKLLAKKGKKDPAAIIGFWISFDPIVDELPAGSPYELWVNIVYDSKITDSVLLAESIRDEVQELFVTIDDQIVLLNAVAVFSEEEFTLGDLQKNVQYRFDHISNKVEPALQKP